MKQLDSEQQLESILEDKSHWQNEVLVSLHEIALGLINRLDVNELLEAIASSATRLIGTPHGHISLVDEEAGIFIRKIGLGYFSQDISRQIKVTDGQQGLVYKTGEIVVINNYTTWEHRLKDSFFDQLYCSVQVPLKSKSTVIGSFGLAFLEPNREFSIKEISLLTRLAEFASIALDNATLYVAAQKEISERKRIEHALRQSESLLKNVLDNIGCGVSVLSPDMRVISVNKVMKNWNSHVNFSEQPICYKAYNTPPRDTVCSYCPVVKTLQDGEVHDAITSTPQGDEIRNFRIKSSPIKDADGQIVSIVEMVEDITEQVRAQEEINKLSIALEQSPSPVIITDAEGRIEYVNPKFTDATEYTLSEVIGKTLNILHSEIHQDTVYQELLDTILAGKEYIGELYHKSKSGGGYWALVSISPIRNRENIITHFLTLHQDITERKQMENDLRNKNIELEEAVNQLKLMQVKLIQQEKLAGIGQLAAGVAHEINNPLGFLMSNFETMENYVTKLQKVIHSYQTLKTELKEIADNDMNEKITNIDKIECECKLDYILSDIPVLIGESHEGLERVSTIVKGLRIFSRKDNQNSFNLYDLNMGVETTLLVARNEIRYIATVETHLGSIPQISAIGSEINQVLMNIIVNAAQAIKQKSIDGYGRITITTSADKNNVYCTISDNGSGIHQNDLKEIFNPFFTTKPVGQGTGLGLSISYDVIINKHQGDISVESGVGYGTTFTITLPIEQEKR